MRVDITEQLLVLPLMISRDILYGGKNVSCRHNRILPVQSIGIPSCCRPVISVRIGHGRNQLILETHRYRRVILHRFIKFFRSLQQMGVRDLQRCYRVEHSPRALKIITERSRERKHPEKSMAIQKIYSNLEIRTFGKLLATFQEVRYQQARQSQTDVHT